MIQRKFRIVVLGSLLTCGYSAIALAAADQWCCLVGGEISPVIGELGKKMCLDGPKAPALKSAVPLEKKYAGLCKSVKGSWKRVSSMPPEGSQHPNVKGIKGALKDKMKDKFKGADLQPTSPMNAVDAPE